ncbi:MAG: hypothetical protein KAI79_07000 [Bacteroidales bacterium]|nr:hypothetical protein [Bacteroidales bacterium]
MKTKTKRKKRYYVSAVNQTNNAFKKEYLKRLKDIFDEIIGLGYFEQVRKIELETIFRLRVSMPIFSYKNKDDFSAQKRKYLKNAFKRYIKEINSKVKINGEYLKMDEYLGVFKTFLWMFPNIKNWDGVRRFQSKIPMFEEKTINNDLNDRAHDNFDINIFNIANHVSKPDKIVNLQFELDEGELNGIPYAKQYIKTEMFYAEKKYFFINGKSRKAYQLGLNILGEGFEWMKIESKHFELENTDDNSQIDVFIQSHAARRFSERMEGYVSYVLMDNFYQSFKKPKLTKTKNNKYLLEYRFKKHKVGYFAGQLIDGVFLVQTFLFITQITTPEGNALSEKLGTKMLDNNYLNLGKIKTYINLSSASAAELYQFFEGTGCEILLELKKNVFDKTNADKATLDFSFSDYLNINKTDEELDNMLDKNADEMLT